MGKEGTSNTDLVSVLEGYAERNGDDVLYRFLLTGEGAPETISGLDLWQRANRIAAFLEERGCRGQRVLFLTPSGIDFIAGLFGCLAAGALVVPAPPPHRERGMARIRSIIGDCNPRLILSTQTQQLAADGSPDPAVAAIPWHVIADVLAAVPTVPASRSRPRLGPEMPAILQYTSGSTGDPKGVVVTHANAIANILQQQKRTSDPAQPELVSWLPVHHDMGLFGKILAAPVLDGRLTFMPPGVFIQKPLRWLRAISDYGAVRSGAPNFAFDLCVKAFDAAALEGLRLDTWRTAFNGAEPVRAETLAAFARLYAPYGFRAESWFPTYGLAEATLIVSGPQRDAPPLVRAFSRSDLENDIARAIPLSGDGAGEESARVLVGCGPVIDEHTLRILSPATGEPLPEGRVGEICFAGPSVSPGFFNRPVDTAERFGTAVSDAPGQSFMRTRDLGFVDDGVLFIVSRLDDLIILRGRNVAPQDIEGAILDLTHVHGATAFTEGMNGGEPAVTAVVEVSRDLRQAEQLAAMAEAIRDTVWRNAEVALARVVLVRPSTLPKTTSGKVRRRETRRLLQEDELKTAFIDAATGPAGAVIAELLPVDPNDAASQIGDQIRRLLDLPQPPAAEEPLYRLGLDSLRAGELAQWMQSTYAASPPFADLLSGATLADCLAAVAAGGHAARIAPSPSLAAPVAETAARVDDRPLTRNQLAMWAEQAAHPGSWFNNVSFAVRLPLTVTPGAVHAALQDIARRHTHLQSRFPAPDGTPRRVTEATAPLPWSEQTVMGGLANVSAVLTEEAHRPFYLETAPAWRAALLQQGSLSVVLLTFHHIICDGWSAARLAEDLSRRLGGSVESTPASSDRPSIDALAGDEEAYLCSAEADDDRRFWRDTLAMPPEPPFTRAPESTGAARRGERGISLSGDRLTRLRAAAAAEKKSVPAVLLALYALTIQQSTRSGDLMIGIAASTRSLQQQGALLAPLVNPILIRVRAPESEQRRLTDVVTETSDALQAAFAHRRLPFSLLEAPPLYCAFGHMRLTHGVIAPDTDWMTSPPPAAPVGLMLEAQAIRAPVALSWFEGDDACWGSLSFDTAVLPEAFADAWPERFLALLDALISDSRTLVANRLTASEQDRLAQWSHGPRAKIADAVAELTMDALITAQAERTPDLPAVIDKDGKARTYRDLLAAAGAIARHLHQSGIVPGDVVAICLPRSQDWVVTALGIWLAGGTFVPIDVEAPRERQLFQITDSQARRVIAEAGRTVVGLANPIPLSDVAVALATPAAAFTPVPADDTRAAYILYTSGSTGQPKGVRVPHAALRERLLWKVETFGLTSDDRVMQSIPLTFDPALWEVFTPLLCGAAVVLPPPNTHREPSLLARVVHDNGITAMSCVAGMMPMIADAFQTLRPPRLRHIITGGERQTAAARQRLQIASGAAIDHCYGPTEATIFCTHAFFPPIPEDQAVLEANTLAIDPIGRPVAGAVIRIVDASGADVPLGTPGELVIGGHGLAIGYVQRPEETSNRFIEIGGERFYRSGDSGRWRDDGQIEVFGRLDEQMKIRGVRIEPAEIEAALCATGLAAEAAVSVVRHASGDRLAAWVTATPELTATVPPLSGRQVLERAARLLPAGLLPSVVTIVATLPRLPNSKIDRRTLATWMPDAVTAGIIEPAANETEELLLRLWRDLLGNTSLGPLDDVFAFGAHSLMIMHLSARVKAETRKLLPVITVFEQRTIRAQARWLRGEDDITVVTDRRPRLSQNSASKNPEAPLVVCIAAGYGDQRRLMSLASALGNACSFWQLLPPGHSPQQEWTLDSLCAAYADLYIEKIGTRPCVLAGFSAAGCIAVELSDVLARRGVMVSGLVLIDSAYPFLPGVALRLFETARDIVRALDRRQWLGTTPTAHHLRQIVLDEGLHVHLKVVAERPPMFFDGDLSIICGSVTDRLNDILFLPWRRHARSLRTLKCNGWHGGMFNADRIAGLATRFAEALLRP